MSFPFEADQWVEVDSSLIKAVGSRGNDLIVEFKGHERYRYPGLACEFEPLVHAESVGKYFHQNVRAQASQRLGLTWPGDDHAGE
jgi:hypothetical protein